MRSNNTESIIDFMIRQMARFPLLPEDRTNELLQQIARMQDAQKCIDRGDEHGLKKPDLDRIFRDGRKATMLLVNSNMRLVLSVAKKYQKLGLPLEDLIQEGAAGLMRGIEKFDPSTGYKLSTFCWHWVRQSMTRSLALKSRAIRLPVKHYGTLCRIRTETKIIAQRLGRMPSRREIAKKLQLKDEDAQRLLLLAREPMSIDIPATEEGTISVAETLESELERPDEHLERADRRNVVRSLITSLSPTEAEVIRSRFSIGDRKPHTAASIGKKIGKSTSQVRYIESKALDKLRERAKNDFSLAALP